LAEAGFAGNLLCRADLAEAGLCWAHLTEARFARDRLAWACLSEGRLAGDVARCWLAMAGWGRDRAWCRLS
jgi:uncharacterized protein YjbI with pentapeptide repeats